jgi:flavin-dependent dehydrogenase
MSTPLHVLVIGGGIGGLCLAQGLRQAGVSVAVYERDRTRADWLQGYRIHINPAGSKALHEWLSRIMVICRAVDRVYLPSRPRSTGASSRGTPWRQGVGTSWRLRPGRCCGR